MKKIKCTSGKNTYMTQPEAQRAADLGMHLRKVQLSTYYCLYCFKFHLTSSKKNKDPF